MHINGTHASLTSGPANEHVSLASPAMFGHLDGSMGGAFVGSHKERHTDRAVISFNSHPITRHLFCNTNGPDRMPSRRSDSGTMDLPCGSIGAGA